MSLEQNIFEMNGRNVIFMRYRGFFFFFFTSLTVEQKHLEEDSPMSCKHIYLFLLWYTRDILFLVPPQTKNRTLFKLCHHTPVLFNS